MGSPAEVLADARRNQVGPFLPAREEWLAGWAGPLLADIEHYGMNVHAVQTRTGDFNGFHEVHFRHGGVCMDAEVALSCIRLDVRRPEVRDHLVRLGCPAWARDVPAAVWAWGMGVRPAALLGQWDTDPPTHGFHCRKPLLNTRVPGGYLLRHEAFDGNVVNGECTGFSALHPSWATCGLSGRAPLHDCRPAADLAALRAGCILEEAGDPRDPTKPPGWYVPLLGGGVGWWTKEGSDAG